MDLSPDEPVFEALTTPHQSGTAAGLKVLVGLVLVGSGGLTALFWSLGAWPVAGFMGGEVVLVIGLLRAHRRWSDRMSERITLAGRHLRVARTDRRGRLHAAELEAYWARAVLTPRPGRVSELRLAARGRSVEVGHFLAEADKTDLAHAVDRALRRYRNPVFDTPRSPGPSA